MKCTIALLLLWLVVPTSPGQSQRLFVRVVDAESHALPGASVKFVPVAASDEHVINTTTSYRGDAFIDTTADAKYELVVSLPNFIPVRLGPFTVTKERSGSPVVIVLNRSLDSADARAPAARDLSDKRE